MSDRSTSAGTIAPASDALKMAEAGGRHSRGLAFGSKRIAERKTGCAWPTHSQGFDKWLKRQGMPGGLTAIWVRERLSGGSAEVVHCHMVFHLAHPFLAVGGRLQVKGALERLIDRHGRGNFADHTLKLTFPRNPDGLYLLKGGGPDVWQAFAVPMAWRKRQGLIQHQR
jgi:hypothetical protein